MLPAALCATEALGVPTVALVHTLYGALLHDGTVSPMSMAATVPAVNHVRADLGLEPIERLGELFTGVAHVVVTVPESIDAPPDPLPPNVSYVGPVFEQADPEVPWSPPTGDGPLVVVSLGTTDMDELPVLARVLGALAHEHARVLATVGDHADPWEIPTPGNATVTRFIQHAAVLPHADLVISHGGIGTCLAALAHGLPVLCLPLGRDQPQNAAAMARTGAAKVLPSSASPKQIAVAVDELLNDPRYRDAAREVAASLPRPGDRHPATTLIADLLP
jgi:MGT family glycosyltransferase